MKVETTKIEGLLILHPNVFGDDRGWFMESFNQQRFEAALKELSLPIPTFVQDNHSLSQKGVLRGLHFQREPYAQGKLVRVVQGKVWDVAVDIRPESKTYGQWVGVELSAENKTMFWIPEGFAHGFQSLTNNTEIIYFVTNYYSKEHDSGLNPFDSKININWAMKCTDISEKDKNAKFIDNNFIGIDI